MSDRKNETFFNKAGINNDFYLKKNALFKISTVSGLSSPSLKYWLMHILAEGAVLSVITLSLTDRRSSEEIYQQSPFVCLFVFFSHLEVDVLFKIWELRRKYIYSYYNKSITFPSHTDWTWGYSYQTLIMKSSPL